MSRDFIVTQNSKFTKVYDHRNLKLSLTTRYKISKNVSCGNEIKVGIKLFFFLQTLGNYLLKIISINSY